MRVHDENDGEASAAAAEAGPPPEVRPIEASEPEAVADIRMDTEDGNEGEAGAAAAEAGPPPEVGAAESSAKRARCV